jgi:hypothetical protein
MGVDVVGGEVEEAGAGCGVRGQDGAATGLSREEGAPERATPHPQPRPQGWDAHEDEEGIKLSTCGGVLCIPLIHCLYFFASNSTALRDRRFRWHWRVKSRAINTLLEKYLKQLLISVSEKDAAS